MPVTTTGVRCITVAIATRGALISRSVVIHGAVVVATSPVTSVRVPISRLRGYLRYRSRLVRRLFRRCFRRSHGRRFRGGMRRPRSFRRRVSRLDSRLNGGCGSRCFRRSCGRRLRGGVRRLDSGFDGRLIRRLVATITIATISRLLNLIIAASTHTPSVCVHGGTIDNNCPLYKDNCIKDATIKKLHFEVSLATILTI